MEFYDIVCGKCTSHDFGSIEGKAACQGCGYVLSDKDIENILQQTYEAAMHCDYCGEDLKQGHWKSQPNGKKICAKCFGQGKYRLNGVQNVNS
jgi:hypothetical protein